MEEYSPAPSARPRGMEAKKPKRPSRPVIKVAEERREGQYSTRHTATCQGELRTLGLILPALTQICQTAVRIAKVATPIQIRYPFFFMRFYDCLALTKRLVPSIWAFGWAGEGSDWVS